MGWVNKGARAPRSIHFLRLDVDVCYTEIPRSDVAKYTDICYRNPSETGGCVSGLADGRLVIVPVPTTVIATKQHVASNSAVCTLNQPPRITVMNVWEMMSVTTDFAMRPAARQVTGMIPAAGAGGLSVISCEGGSENELGTQDSAGSRQCPRAVTQWGLTALADLSVVNFDCRRLWLSERFQCPRFHVSFAGVPARFVEYLGHRSEVPQCDRRSRKMPCRTQISAGNHARTPPQEHRLEAPSSPTARVRVPTPGI